jgi:putative oxidoreductase
MLGAASTHLPNGFFMNWFGTLKPGVEGFEYHVIALALAAVVIIEGSGALSVDGWVARWAGGAAAPGDAAAAGRAAHHVRAA